MTEKNHISVWESCLVFLRGMIDEQGFDTWFRPIIPVKLENNTLTLEVPSDFFREYLEEHFVDFLAMSLKKEIGSDAKLEYQIRIDHVGEPSTFSQGGTREYRNKTVSSESMGLSNPFSSAVPKHFNINPQLNPNYTFSNFVEGICNRLGRSAGIAISENPGKTFNPFFIYGGSGLGKTHLAQAIGIAIKERFPEKIVLYVPANRFQTQYMDAVNIKNKLTDFLHFYQMIDVLIIDDVQEFADKPGTQNAFFHIFNHLQQNRKQLVLTSDRSPAELKGLEQRLLTRFKWGLSVELEKPDFETRRNILISKSKRDGIVLPEEVLNYLAMKIDSNVRELEGTLVSLIAHSTYNRQPITLELAKQLIEKIVTNTSKEISIKLIVDMVCDYFGIKPESLQDRTKKREIVQARQIAMYLSRNHTVNSLSVIGSKIGGKNHATVLHACNTVSDLMDTDKTFKQYVTDIETSILGS